MKLKKAVLTGALLWGLIFLETRMLKTVFNLQAPDFTYYIIHYSVMVLLVSLMSLIYFRKTKANAFEGLYLGFMFIFVGIVLDSTITIPLFMGIGYIFLISVRMLISYAINLGVCALVGFLKE